MAEFRFGPAWAGPTCCGKPVGCHITDGCIMLRHPWKRQYARKIKMDIAEEVTTFIKGAVVPESFDMYFRKTPIPILGNRTWERTIENGDEKALRHGLMYLKDLFGDG